MRKIINVSILLVVELGLSALAFAGGKRDEAAQNSSAKSAPIVIASTSWTAAFADIAGADDVEAIAPANLQHPPEYEVTVGDIQKIGNADYFIYAGFERMMQTLGSSVGRAEMVQIANDNSIETVTRETAKIAALIHTEQENEKRLARYVAAITEARAELERRGFAGVKVLCNRNQRYLANDLGFDVAEIFGPGPVTSEQIADASASDYALIIDNVHNPTGSPLAEVARGAKYIVWRNFPERVEKDALLHVVEENIAALMAALEI